MAEKKKAIPKLKRGADGRNKIVYLDLDTAQEIDISDLEQYEIITADSGDYWSTKAKVEAEKPKSEDDNDLSPFRREDNQNRSGSDETSLRYSGEKDGYKSKTRDPSNNYGYVNKPKALGVATTLASVFGGPAGKLGSMAVHGGINAENLAAVNAARERIGLDKLGFKDSIKTIARGSAGQVADVKIGKEDYSVGLKAMSPQGRTNLTPDEAVKRGLATGNSIIEIPTRPDVPGNKSGSIASRITGLEDGWGARALDSLFGRTRDDPVKAGLPEPVAREVALKDLTPNKFANSTQTFPEQRQVEVSKPTNLPDARSIAQGVGFIADYGPKRPGDPNQEVFDAVGQAVKNTLGEGYTVVGISGKGEYGSHRHRQGEGLDFDVLDPNGNKVLDGVTLDNLAVELARANPQAGIGLGEGYMAPGRTHFDLAGPAAQWGWDETNATMDPILSKEIDLARRGMGMPTPTPAPRPGQVPIGGGLMMGKVGGNLNPVSGMPIPDNTYASPLAHPGQNRELERFASTTSAIPSAAPRESAVNTPVGQSLDPLKNESVLSDLSKSAESYAKSLVSENIRDDTPAELASKGFISRTPEQIDRMAYALAGELSPEQLRGLEANDPVARRELANMVTTIENRAAARITGGQFDRVLDPTQYNSMMAGKLATPNNYSVYKDVLNTSIGQFYSGQLAPDNFDFTNYHATYANPGWGGLMADPTVTGDHRFGILGPAQGDFLYTPTTDYVNYRDQVGYALGTMDRTGSGTFGTTDSPGYNRSSLGVSAYAGGGPTGGSASDYGGGGALGGRSSGPSPSSPAGGARAASGLQSYGSDNGGGSNYAGESRGPSPSSPAGGSRAASGGPSSGSGSGGGGATGGTKSTGGSYSGGGPTGGGSYSGGYTGGGPTGGGSSTKSSPAAGAAGARS